MFRESRNPITASARPLGLALLCAIVAAGLGGCEGLPTGGAQVETESIFSMFSGPTPVEAAAWAVDPYDADKRARGILLLANASFGGERVYVDVYEASLNDSDMAVRASAVRALALHGDSRHAPRIAVQLESQDRLLRWEAARALQRLHNPLIVDALVRRLDPRTEPESEIRAAAATALGQYAETRVIDNLIAALDDRDLLVNRAAQDSLRTLTGEDFRFDVRRWVAWRRETSEPFAGRSEYVFPVFYRTPSWIETIVPWMTPPNEVASVPVGMPVTTTRADDLDSKDPAGDALRNK